MDRLSLPNLKHLRVFGCPTYVHILHDKLEPIAERCIFLGYLSGVKAYKLCSLEFGKGKCIISRDVTFNEDQKGTETFEIELQPNEVAPSNEDSSDDHEHEDEPPTDPQDHSIEQPVPNESDDLQNLADY